MLPIIANREVSHYFKILNPDGIPDFLTLYCMAPSVERLDGVGYFCGADYHKIEGQCPKYFYSRLDHSIACSLIIWNKTHNRQAAILALLHDIGTPCFAHALDYGLNDSKTQESSEKDIKEVIEEDQILKGLLELDGIDYKNIDLKNESLVELNRPCLCTDRLEGVFSPNLIWSQKITLRDIKEMYKHVLVLKNEHNKREFGFDDIENAKKCFLYNQEINRLTESKEDRLTMKLLGDILCYGIHSGCFTKEELYHLTEYDIINKIKHSSNTHLKHYFKTYCSLTEVYTTTDLEQVHNCYNAHSIKVKKRLIDPLVETEGWGSIRLSQVEQSIKREMFDYENTPNMDDYPYVKLLWKQKRK